MSAATTTAARNYRGSHTEGRSPAELRDLVNAVGAELELAPAEDIIEWAAETFGERFCITSSMGDAVLAHVASRVVPGIDVVFLDTGYHFAETIGTRDAVELTLPVRMLSIEPAQMDGTAQENQVMQNRMMMARVKWQAITIILLVLIGLFAAGK